MKKALGALAVVGIVIVIAVIALVSSATKTPETYEVGRAFIGHLAAADYEAAYGLTATDLQAEYSVNDLQIFVEDRQALFTDSTTIQFTQRGVDNNVRYAAGTLTSGDLEVPLYMEFVDDDGETRLIYFSFSEEDIPEIGGGSSNF